MSEVVEDVEVIGARSDRLDILDDLDSLDYLGFFGLNVGLTSLRVAESIRAIAVAALTSAAAPALWRLAAGGSGASGSA